MVKIVKLAVLFILACCFYTASADWTELSTTDSSTTININTSNEILELRSFINYWENDKDKANISIEDSTGVVGNIHWWFSSTNEDGVYDQFGLTVDICANTSNSTVMTSVDHSVNKIWRISLGELGLLIECNDIQVYYNKDFPVSCDSNATVAGLQVKLQNTDTSVKEYRISDWLPAVRGTNFAHNATLYPLSLKTAMSTTSQVHLTANSLQYLWTRWSNGIALYGCSDLSDMSNMPDDYSSYRVVDVFRTSETFQMDINQNNVYWINFNEEDEYYDGEDGYDEDVCTTLFDVYNESSSESSIESKRRKKRDSSVADDVWSEVAVSESDVMFHTSDNATIAYKSSGWKLADSTIGFIEHSLRTYPLSVRTVSVYGEQFFLLILADAAYNTSFSDSVANVSDGKFQDIPSIIIYYNSTDIQYYITNCTTTVVTIGTDESTSKEMKTWTFYQTSTAINILCNGVEVVNYSWADGGTSCQNRYSTLETERVGIAPVGMTEDATEELFYKSAECDGIELSNGSWTASLPVSRGDRLYASCNDGFVLKGDSYVTCIGGSMYTSDETTPECVEFTAEIMLMEEVALSWEARRIAAYQGILMHSI